MPEYLTTRAVAERLGVHEWDIENAIRRREVERPPIVGKTRLWSVAGIDALRVALVRRGRISATRGAASRGVR